MIKHKLIYIAAAAMMLNSGICKAAEMNVLIPDDILQNDTDLSVMSSDMRVNISTSYGNSKNDESLLLNGEYITLSVSVENVPSFGEDLFLAFAVYDKNGDLINVSVFNETITEDTSVFEKRIKLPADADNAKIMAWNKHLSPYCASVRLSSSGMDAYGDDITNARSISSGDRITGKLNIETDEDWFSFTASDDLKTTLNKQGDADITVYNSSGSVILPSDGLYSFVSGNKYYLKASIRTGSTGQYSFQVYKPSVILGVEYEQIHSDLPDIVQPRINNVGVDVLNFIDGIYKITLSLDDCTYDSRAENTFFFWNSNDGSVSDSIMNPDGSVSFVYHTSSLAGGNARLIVGFGDGLGGTDKKVVILKAGN